MFCDVRTPPNRRSSVFNFTINPVFDKSEILRIQHIRRHALTRCLHSLRHLSRKAYTSGTKLVLAEDREVVDASSLNFTGLEEMFCFVSDILGVS